MALLKQKTQVGLRAALTAPLPGDLERLTARVKSAQSTFEALRSQLDTALGDDRNPATLILVAEEAKRKLYRAQLNAGTDNAPTVEEIAELAETAKRAEAAVADTRLRVDAIREAIEEAREKLHHARQALVNTALPWLDAVAREADSAAEAAVAALSEAYASAHAVSTSRMYSFGFRLPSLKRIGDYDRHYEAVTDIDLPSAMAQARTVWERADQAISRG